MSDRKIVKFDNIELEQADNGFVLEYSEVSEKIGTMDNRDWNRRQMVFLDGENDDNGGIDLALAKMKEMYIFNRLRKDGVSSTSVPGTENSSIVTRLS